TVVAGDTISVTANDSSGIYSNSKLVAETSVSTDGGASIIQETINDVVPADSDSRPDEGQTTKIRNVKFGDRVRIADDFGGNVVIDLNRMLPPSKFPIATGDAVQFEGTGDESGPIYQYNGKGGVIDLEALVAGI